MPPNKEDKAPPTREEQERNIKNWVWETVEEMVDAVAIQENRNTTKRFNYGVATILWTQLQHITHDLESFSRHAGRTAITTDDVLLVTRRNDDLHDLIKIEVERLKAERIRKSRKEE